MAAIGTLPVLLDGGTHAGRPAASDVGVGGLYSCTDHSLIYQTDGSSWATWATLGSAASGSITASGYTQSTARLLGRTTASSGAIEEITVGSGLTLSAGSLTASGTGSYALSSDVTAGAAQASFDFTSIPGTAKHIFIETMIRGAKSAGFDDLHCRVNGDTGGNYDLQLQTSFSTTTAASQGLAGTSWGVLDQPPAASATAGLHSYVRIMIPYYADTNFRKNGRFEVAAVTAEGSGGIVVRQGTLHWRAATAITQVTLYFAGGNVAQNSRASLYLIS